MVSHPRIAVRDLIDQALRIDPARPLLTFYDDTTGERVELSVATYANWVTKTANFLRDGLGTVAGDRISIRLPAHWQSAVWVSACWSLGATPAPVAPGATAATAAVAVVAHDDELPAPPADELVVLGLGPMGLPRPSSAGSGGGHHGAIEYDREIHGYPDHFSPDLLPRDDDHLVVLDLGDGPITQSRLLSHVDAALATWRVEPGDRLLSTHALHSLPAILATVVVPLVAGTGLVLCRNLEPHRLATRATSEHVVGMLPVEDLTFLIAPELIRF